MVLRPVVKAKKSRQRVAEWLVGNFPEDYRELAYLEPFVGDGSVILAKDRSVEEVVSDCDLGLVEVWRAVRDEHKTFSSRIKRMDHSKATFERCLKGSGGDYMDVAVREFALRCMSKEGFKKSYIPRREKVKCGECWCDIFERMPLVQARMRDVYIVSADALGLIRSFSGPKRFVFCDVPATEDSGFHVSLGEAMNAFRGKALVCSKNSAMNRRIYANWNRKGLHGSKGESLWANF